MVWGAKCCKFAKFTIDTYIFLLNVLDLHLFGNAPLQELLIIDKVTVEKAEIY
jgi:hypothetical protein